MALPVPGDDARGLLSFRLFGFPVEIHGSFLLMAFLFGSARGIDGALVWVAVVTVSVVAHELGHAFVAPRGSAPRIDLFALAGLTRWNAARTSRARLVAVSFAGPAAGVAFGLGVLALYAAVDPDPGTLLDYAFADAVFANLAWGVLNLLPMLPLDGGQILRALLPAKDEESRARRAAIVSTAVAGIVATVAAVVGQPVAAAFVVFLGFGNVRMLLALRDAKTAAVAAQPLARAEELLAQGRAAEAMEAIKGNGHPAARVLAAACLIRLGRPRVAQNLLLDSRIELDDTFEAVVLWANGQERLARERLAVSLRSGPPAWAVRELAALLLREGRDLDEVFADVTGEALSGVVTALYYAGDHADAARWGDRALTTGAESPWTAYNTACAWARAGDADRALRAFDHAVLLGFGDAALADGDDDLANVRALPGWADVRARLGAPVSNG